MGHQRTGGQPPTSQHQGSPPQPTTVMANPERPGALEDKLDEVLLAIDDTWASLESKIDAVSSDLGLLHEDHKKLADRVTLMEHTVKATQDGLFGCYADGANRVKVLEQSTYVELFCLRLVTPQVPCYVLKLNANM
ncbi:hypothetical protein NDU88_011023 [Pleurodeles waltl]|uniref:t-SNARE coiled-coil homology domain-containing protein n=1 Tax=Pleurodeles waltl TaxID=8319 RepID=A0AAV7S2W7_PLEWA|nr:hypothetical protein NDU88_011023 [Pleurodeles waltl]